MCTSWREMVWWTKSNFLDLSPKCGKDQQDCEIGNHFPYNNNILYLYLGIWYLFLSRFENILNIARSHFHNSMCKPKKFDLVHQTAFPRESLKSKKLRNNASVETLENTISVMTTHTSVPFSVVCTPFPRTLTPSAVSLQTAAPQWNPQLPWKQTSAKQQY